ncbi:mCG1036929, isoform CRA_b, partial [Mus musculus]
GLQQGVPSCSATSHTESHFSATSTLLQPSARCEARLAGFLMAPSVAGLKREGLTHIGRISAFIPVQLLRMLTFCM